MRITVLAAAALLCIIPTTAQAQLRGKFSIGASVGKFTPQSDELKTKVSVVPTISRVPKPGWGVAGGLNWFNADLAGDFVGQTNRFGKVNVRPFMGGVGYTVMSGRFSINPTLIAGPAWTTLEVDDALRDAFAVRGNIGSDEFRTKAHALSFAVRPGVSATYAVAPRFGITAFAGYLFNRPDFDVLVPTGETRTTFKADGLSVSAGVVVPVF